MQQQQKHTLSSLDISKGCLPHGPVCIVTGGSRGIGKETVIALAASAPGAKVTINHLPEERNAAEKVAETVHSLGGEAFCVEGNVAKQADCEHLVKATVDKWGHLDCLINNAAIMLDAAFLDMTPQQWHDTIENDLTSIFYTCQAAIKVMQRAGKGRIVNISSVESMTGQAMRANYAAAKAGMVGLTKSIAAEFASSGIICNAVAPGFIDTAMTSEEALGAVGLEGRKQIPSLVPLGRIGHPAEVAGLVRYLSLDPSAGYITGHMVHINGGMIMV